MDAVTAPATIEPPTEPIADLTTGSPAPDELADRLRLGATRLARILRQQSDADLTPTQVAALATLHRRGPIPLGALADEEQIAAPTATKIVDKLASAGLVDRLADPTDRRVSLVATTTAGEAVLAEIRARKTAWLTTRLADLDPADRDRLAAALDVLERLVAAPRPADPTPQEPQP